MFGRLGYVRLRESEHSNRARAVSGKEKKWRSQDANPELGAPSSHLYMLHNRRWVVVLVLKLCELGGM